MPRFLTVCVVLAITLLAGCATQTKKALTQDQVPAPAVKTFRQMFPEVKKVEWSIKADQNYEAEFFVAEAEIAAKFDAAGKWVETETAIPPASVPAAVQATVTAKFKGYKQIETQSIKRPESSGLAYELHLDNGKEIVKAQFAADGAILNQQSKPKP